jgi:hypothetical protein
MTTPFPFVSGAVLTAAQLNDIQNLPISDKTASYVLIAGDETKRTMMNAAGATTITVDDSIFTVGDVIQVANKGAGVCTITAGAGVTINTSGSLALAQYGGGYLLCLSASTFTFFNLGAAGTIAIDYLVIAGGGGGGIARGGGGGAGGYRNSVSGELTGGGGSAETTLQLLRNTNYTVQVGAGGAAVTAGRGLPGNFSQFGNIVSTGGGGGGNETSGSRDGLGGGSGGGGANTSTGGAATTVPVQGFAGGNGSFVGDSAGGGGGGASEVGQNAGSLVSGDGGDGLSSSITGSAVTRSGGGGGSGGTNGAAGTGGGTAGNSNTAGTVNTGGGSGAGSAPGGGGSGVVILRYADTLTITIGAGLTGTESAASGGYKRATITAGAGNVSFA